MLPGMPPRLFRGSPLGFENFLLPSHRKNKDKVTLRRFIGRSSQ